MIHANQWVSLSTSTSPLKRHTRNPSGEDRKRELVIFSITILVNCLGASFAFPWHKIKKHCDSAQKFRRNNNPSKTAQTNLNDPLKLH